MSFDMLTSIKPELMFILPILYAIGEIIKKTKIKNWLIPFILWGVSIVLTSVYLLIGNPSADSIYIGIIQGTVIALATVGSNQVYKQAAEKRLIDNDKNIKDN